MGAALKSLSQSPLASLACDRQHARVGEGRDLAPLGGLADDELPAFLDVLLDRLERPRPAGADIRRLGVEPDDGVHGLIAQHALRQVVRVRTGTNSTPSVMPRRPAVFAPGRLVVLADDGQDQFLPPPVRPVSGGGSMSLTGKVIGSGAISVLPDSS